MVCGSLKCEFHNEVNAETLLLSAEDIGSIIAHSETESLHLRMLFSVTQVYQQMIEQLVDRFCSQVLKPASVKPGLH